MSLRVWTVLAATAALLTGLTATAQAEASYRFVNVKADRCMSVSSGGSTANNTRVIQWSWVATGYEQVWGPVAAVIDA